MKFLHTGDLHLGRKWGEFPLIEDQRFILNQMDQIAQANEVDAILIAGDLFDRKTPPVEAVTLFDDFLTMQVRAGRSVVLIAGNHDSPERLDYGSRVMNASGVHVAGRYNGVIHPIEFSDVNGKIFVWPIPYLWPGVVRAALSDERKESIQTYDDALAEVIHQLPIDSSARNVALAHQYLVGAARSDSEDMTVGGLDSVAAELFDPFDYVALGHLHSAQEVGRETVRYAGTPLAYAVSEQKPKSVTLATFGAKDDLRVEQIKLEPLRKLRVWNGTWATWLADPMTTDDWLSVTLTDEIETPEARAQILRRCPHLIQFQYDNTRTRAVAALEGLGPSEHRNPCDLAGDFFKNRTGRTMSPFQQKLTEQLIEKIWRDEV